MTPTPAQYALIGRAFPGEMFEPWLERSRKTREQRRSRRGWRVPVEADAIKRAPFPIQDGKRG
jgi:hypothetical protein